MSVINQMLQRSWNSAGQMPAQRLHRCVRWQDSIALRSNPVAGPWLLGLGISLQADGQKAKAEESFNRARQSNSLSPELQAFAEQRLEALQ